MLLALVCVLVTLALVVLLVVARRSLRREQTGWVQTRLDDDVVLWHDATWDEETHAAAREVLRRARRTAAER